MNHEEIKEVTAQVIAQAETAIARGLSNFEKELVSFSVHNGIDKLNQRQNVVG